MTYCNALDGTTWTRDKQCDFVKGKNLQTDIVGYRQKVAFLRERVKSLQSDVFAFQELNNMDALTELFAGIEGYVLFVSTSKKSNLHVGYAIKEALSPSFTQIDTFVVDTCGTRRANEQCKNQLTRPGLEAEIETAFGPLTLLNVHLKSGCQFYPIDQITEGEIRSHECEKMDERLDRIITGCSTLRKQIPILEDWIEKQASINPNFLILGDFNRNINGDLRYDARIDGTDRTKPITEKTQIASLLKEISDGVPKNASIVVGRQVLETSKVGGYDACWTGIDWIALSAAFAEQFRWSVKNKPKLTGADFRPYNKDKPIASDHCPVSLEITRQP